MHIKCSAALAVCLWLLCSCAPLRNRDTDYSIRPALPAEVFFNKGGQIYVTVRVENGEEGLFSVDTGSPITILDKSLEAKLGKRLGTIKICLRVS